MNKPWTEPLRKTIQSERSFTMRKGWGSSENIRLPDRCCGWRVLIWCWLPSSLQGFYLVWTLPSPISSLHKTKPVQFNVKTLVDIPCYTHEGGNFCTLILVPREGELHVLSTCYIIGELENGHRFESYLTCVSF